MKNHKNTILGIVITAIVCAIFFNRKEILNILGNQQTPSWASAIATGLAVIVALWLGINQNSAIKRQEREKSKVLQAALTPECTLLLKRLTITINSLERFKNYEIGEVFDKRYINYSRHIIEMPALEITIHFLNELHSLSNGKGERIAKIYANLAILRREIKTIDSFKAGVTLSEMIKKLASTAFTRASTIIDDLKFVLEIKEEDTSKLVEDLIDTVEIDGEILIYSGTKNQ